MNKVVNYNGYTGNVNYKHKKNPKKDKNKKQTKTKQRQKQTKNNPTPQKDFTEKVLKWITLKQSFGYGVK